MSSSDACGEGSRWQIALTAAKLSKSYLPFGTGQGWWLPDTVKVLNATELYTWKWLIFMWTSLQLKKKKSWLSPGPLAGLRCTSIPEIQGLRITLNQGSRVTFPVRTHSRGESHSCEQTIRPRTMFLAQQDPDLCASLTHMTRCRGFHNFLCCSCLPPQSYSLFNFYHIIAYFTLASSPLHLIRNVSYVWNAWQCAAEH